MSTDLHITLQYLSDAALARVCKSLREDPQDATAGWYVDAYRNVGYDPLVKITRISGIEAENIGCAVDNALQPASEPRRVFHAVRATNLHDQKAREERRHRLISTIDAAQRALAALDGESVIAPIEDSP